MTPRRDGGLLHDTGADRPTTREDTPMPKQIPCLWFDGKAEEAAAHYTSIFPNSSIGEVSRYGPDMPMPEGTAMTVAFTLDGQDYVGLNGGPQFSFTEAISFQIMCADQEEADHYWNRLTDGGEESMCGWKEMASVNENWGPPLRPT